MAAPADTKNINPSLPLEGDAALKEMHRRSRRSFLAGGLAAAGAYAFWHWIEHSPQIGELQAPLRRAAQFNSAVSRHLLGDSGRAPTFPVNQAVANVRVNGVIGLDPALNLDSWRLQVTGVAQPERSPHYLRDVNAWKYSDAADLMDENGDLDTYVDGPGNSDREHGMPHDAEPGLLLGMDSIRALPHVEMVTQLKCIEGWSEIVYWGGARLCDFMAAYPPARGRDGALPRFVGLETPDRQYYVGLYREDALHPQTLLCYEINGQPLSRDHGAPLRLVTPLKYGIKHLKQIGKITYTDQRPRDYWAENGYDWYEGH